jgi:oxepin-CoA hydrolase/3-oxo-5,6-dehydrosuberyl-CoA semialdehyde dehydrogenase
MKPQQMVEHLIDQVQYTNGKKEPFCEVSEEQAQVAKQINVYTAVEIPRNVIFGEISDQLIYPDLPSAIQQVMTELADFDQHFMKPETLVIHGGFGPMNYKEWCIWHSKHFSHHLKQFKIPAPPLLH